jgi:DNA-binding transcriptional regulator YhcF (GntR family)
MRVRLDRSSSVPLARQLVTALRLGIERGLLPPSERLAPVRTLADELDLAPNTVAKAYRELERDGYLQARGRGGTFVASTLPVRPDDAGARLDAAAGAYVRRARQVAASDAEALAAVRRALGRRTPDRRPSY